MDLKPISYADLPALTEIARESLIYDRITASIIGEKIFEEPYYRPDHALKVLDNERIVSFMVGHVDEEKTGWIKVFATH
ncbi:MAG TPA: hypothetical protein PLG59_19230, partial [bacterium]|nr:hypothetical protein [bacterium]